MAKSSVLHDDRNLGEAVPRGFPAIGVRAGTLHHVDAVLPLAARSLPVGDAPRALAGVSLSGLFAVYAAHCTDAFDRICSISGSLWYDGFLDFMARTPVSPAVRRAYLSVGSREKNAGNPRVRQVEDCTRRVAARLRQQGVDVRMEINPGSHFADADARLRKGLAVLLEE